MVEGGCLCGEVRFEVAEFSSQVFKCHCSKCRKNFGGASSAAALAPADKFTWLKGAERIRHYSPGGNYHVYFCEQCGSTLPQLLQEYQSVWVPAGLLDSDPGLVLGSHVHVDSKAPWELLDDRAKRYAEGFGSQVLET